jgi:hypothetical protein
VYRPDRQHVQSCGRRFGHATITRTALVLLTSIATCEPFLQCRRPIRYCFSQGSALSMKLTRSPGRLSSVYHATLASLTAKPVDDIVQALYSEHYIHLPVLDR